MSVYILMVEGGQNFQLSKKKKISVISKWPDLTQLPPAGVHCGVQFVVVLLLSFFFSLFPPSICFFLRITQLFGDGFQFGGAGHLWDNKNCLRPLVWGEASTTKVLPSDSLQSWHRKPARR